jgi:hypothetical protein
VPVVGAGLSIFPATGRSSLYVVLPPGPPGSPTTGAAFFTGIGAALFTGMGAAFFTGIGAAFFTGMGAAFFTGMGAPFFGLSMIKPS